MKGSNSMGIDQKHRLRLNIGNDAHVAYPFSAKGNTAAAVECATALQQSIKCIEQFVLLDCTVCR